MTQTAPADGQPAARRRTTLPKVIALLGLLAIVVLWGFELQALTWESGDRVLHLNTVSLGFSVITTAAAIWWLVWAPRKGAAITVLVVSILISPIWMFALILVFG